MRAPMQASCRDIFCLLFTVNPAISVSPIIQVISNLSATTRPLFSLESWGRFPKERDRLFKLIADTKVIAFNYRRNAYP